MSFPQLITSKQADPRAEFFVKNVHETLKQRFSQKSVSRFDLPSLQLWLDQQFAGCLEASPAPWLLAEGCAVIGIGVWFSEGNLFVRWRTGISTGQRTVIPAFDPGEPAELGNYGDYALKGDISYPAAPLLSACCPGKDEQWTISKVEPVENSPGVIQEAFRRARLVNLFAGTEWATPCPYGTMGIPALGCQDDGQND